MPVIISVLAVAAAVATPAAAQQPADAPREVKIGLLMTDLTEVRGAEQAFAADVFVLATW